MSHLRLVVNNDMRQRGQQEIVLMGVRDALEGLAPVGDSSQRIDRICSLAGVSKKVLLKACLDLYLSRRIDHYSAHAGELHFCVNPAPAEVSF